MKYGATPRIEKAAYRPNQWEKMNCKTSALRNWQYGIPHSERRYAIETVSRPLPASARERKGREGCLKINESSYIDARPFSVIDFLHGSVAMLEKDAPVLPIDADQATRADARTIL